MSQDRSDEIRVIVLNQRIEKFRKYLNRKQKEADGNAAGSGSSWNNACADTLDLIKSRFDRIMSGKEDKPPII